MALAQSDGSKIHNSLFKKLADEIVRIGKKNDVKIKGYHSESLPLFSALSATAKTNALKHLETFLRSLEMVENSGGNHSSQERALWGALSTLGLLPPTEMFSLFHPDDVVEIYDLQGIQIWRNFNFLGICSYTLEEVFSLEWHKRYSRDEERTLECQEKVGMLLSGQTPTIYHVDVSEHLVEESLSAERFILSLKYRFIARLKNTEGTLSAWIVASQVKIVGHGVSPHPQKMGDGPRALHLV